jgi:4'-phosphopantetheinyl transferase
VDVVCPPERRARDHELLARDGWARYVDMHDSVFSAAECVRLRELGRERDEMLEYFYALWCLREGYVKMTGEALLAEWLGELEMRYFAPPGRTAPEGRELEVWFRGVRERGVDVRLVRFLEDYMICTVVRGDVGVDLGGEFEVLDLDGVLDAAEKSNSVSR